jgi:hypothetical protein
MNTQDLSPVPRAKIELLEWLKSSGSWEAMLLSDELLEARTLRELGERAHAITVGLQQVNEWHTANEFWEAAKGILVRCRDA